MIRRSKNLFYVQLIFSFLLGTLVFLSYQESHTLGLVHYTYIFLCLYYLISSLYHLSTPHLIIGSNQITIYKFPTKKAIDFDQVQIRYAVGDFIFIINNKEFHRIVKSDIYKEDISKMDEWFQNTVLEKV